MHATRWNALLLTGLVSALLIAPAGGTPADAQGRGRGRVQHSAPVRDGAFTRQRPREYHEPAFARGYDDGYARGLTDGGRGERYDPVESREYRRGNRGYANAYGSPDAYRTNYRAGFRQGYEDGYRDGTR